MGNILIDKLLHACIKQGASDIHLTVGQPPVFRMDGQHAPAGDESARGRRHRRL